MFNHSSFYFIVVFQLLICDSQFLFFFSVSEINIIYVLPIQ